MLRAYVGQKLTQLHIVSVIRRRLHRKTPRYIVDEILSDVSLRVLATTARPESEATMRAWLTTLTIRARNQYFRGGAAHEKWINKDAEVEELPPEPLPAPSASALPREEPPRGPDLGLPPPEK